VCLAVPGRVDAVEDEDGLRMAVVDFGGLRKRVCLETLPEAREDDWILVHAGFGLQVLDARAAETMRAGLGGEAPEA
jgi:hydrogenase expression/formation protein HypC